MQIPVKKRAIQKPNAEYFQLCGNLEEGKRWVAEGLDVGVQMDRHRMETLGEVWKHSI